MARNNTLGSSFLALRLEKIEEKQLKKIIEDDEISGNKLLRKLVREYLKQRLK